MSAEALERFVGEMSVADVCGRLGCSVEELLSGSSRPRAPVTEPESKRSPVEGSLEALLERPFKDARAEFERCYVQHLIKRCDGNRTLASRRAGVSRSALYNLLDKG